MSCVTNNKIRFGGREGGREGKGESTPYVGCERYGDLRGWGRVSCWLVKERGRRGYTIHVH